MRWDRLFADLEAVSVEIAKSEAEGLAGDLRDEIWAETSWRDLIGGQVVLEVSGAGQVTGEVAAINERLIRLRAGMGGHLVACSAVSGVLAAERRADPPSRIDAAMGWGQALRRLRDDAGSVRLVLGDGRTFDGSIEVVGHDFVRLTAGSATRTVVLDAIAVVTSAG
ncbi:hypothetical protein [Aeromicrobium sp. CF3.5]|uniref:hypothetical protein n=1 Tax=Aeromicrobium sp. CF3.5 TaxID=3373078 RepID=UPI003EE56573